MCLSVVFILASSTHILSASIALILHFVLCSSDSTCVFHDENFHINGETAAIEEKIADAIVTRLGDVISFIFVFIIYIVISPTK